jgi:hypothetical protein
MQKDRNSPFILRPKELVMGKTLDASLIYGSYNNLGLFAIQSSDHAKDADLIQFSLVVRCRKKKPAWSCDCGTLL